MKRKVLRGLESVAVTMTSSGEKVDSICFFGFERIWMECMDDATMFMFHVDDCFQALEGPSDDDERTRGHRDSRMAALLGS